MIIERLTVHFQDGPEAIDRRTLLARGGAAIAGLLVTGCSRNQPRGFSADGLERLRSGLQRHIEPGFAPGLVGLVARRDDVEAFVLGKMAFDGGADMRRDTIFRIASMTKAITAAAVMMLVEEGRLRLDEPVDRLLPELANRRVLAIDRRRRRRYGARQTTAHGRGPADLSLRPGDGSRTTGSVSHPESHRRSRRQRRRFRPAGSGHAIGRRCLDAEDRQLSALCAAGRGLVVHGRLEHAGRPGRAPRAARCRASSRSGSSGRWG